VLLGARVAATLPEFRDAERQTRRLAG
jgi:hypothetical protein